MFDRAQDKIFRQLDVVNIIKWIEQLKLLSKGLLNHKQKFWLKFQKEHVLEIDINSDEERIRKRKEQEQEDKDLIKGIQKQEKKSVDKVKRMLKYLRHGNRTTFDKKIIQGLFEEYVSDSDEEVQENRVMDTEEEYKEFYSLALPLAADGRRASEMRPPTEMRSPSELRRKQFNTRIIGDKVIDISSLKKLYEKEDGIASIGNSKTPSVNNSSTSPTKKLLSKKSMRNTIDSPLNVVVGSKFKGKKSKTREKWNTRSVTKKSGELSSQVQQIHEYDEEEEEDSAETLENKTKKQSILIGCDDSLMDSINDK